MNLRTRFERYCFKNRDKGIQNLMLYIAIGNAIVGLMSMINGGNVLYSYLCFDKEMILKGQVWRLVTYVFTQSGSDLLSIIFLYFFYLLGKYVETSMGTFKFNLYYLSGVLLMDVFAMCFSPILPAYATSQEELVYYTGLIQNVMPMYRGMAMYLHLSLLLTFATLNPDSQFLIMFIIPIKGWIIGILYLLIELITIFNLSYPTIYFPHNLFPLIALANYLLFMGKDVLNLIPLSWRKKKQRSKKAATGHGTIQFRSAPKKVDYSHRCTICGRTDVSNPELEFRYCSRCNGYFCYCEDHINNHTHIQ